LSCGSCFPLCCLHSSQPSPQRLQPAGYVIAFLHVSFHGHVVEVSWENMLRTASRSHDFSKRKQTFGGWNSCALSVAKVWSCWYNLIVFSCVLSFHHNCTPKSAILATQAAQIRRRAVMKKPFNLMSVLSISAQRNDSHGNAGNCHGRTKCSMKAGLIGNYGRRF
jgi:hypothetical protein